MIWSSNGRTAPGAGNGSSNLPQASKPDRLTVGHGMGADKGSNPFQVNYTMNLFNEYECMTPAAQDFSERVERVLHPIVQDMVDKGASTRGLTAILVNQVDAMLCEMRLLRSVAMHQLERTMKKEAHDARVYNESAD